MAITSLKHLINYIKINALLEIRWNTNIYQEYNLPIAKIEVGTAKNIFVIVRALQSDDTFSNLTPPPLRTSNGV